MNFPADHAEVGKVGQVSTGRYEQLVAQARELVESVGRAQFALGDLALEIEPMNPAGTGGTTAAGWGVERSMRQFADDIGLAAETVKHYRWTSAWCPRAHRQPKVSHRVHEILAAIGDEQGRWEQIKHPPLDELVGRHRWTCDTAKRVVGCNCVDTPFTVPEKVRAVREFTRDEQVAAQVATELLHRPDVAFKAMADDVAKDMVNRAQVDHTAQAVNKHAEPVAPVMRELNRRMEFVDLIAACAAFTAAVQRCMAMLKDHPFAEREREALRDRLTQVRAAADWIERAAETGNLTLDEALAAILRDK
ncbi:DUF6192 family protein [Actinomadura terrae]|uniref:DUF6192 family protein n=1 Tax=Actinomadura terrae TaxID=604353 RepID=UPI001FA70230|nr:DUF6192 family protein [Actinomadura terrae]